MKRSYLSYANLSYISPDDEWKESDTSPEVKTAEEMLTQLGYNPGKVDGLYDQDTKLAVVQFQRDQKLKGTGVLGR